MRQWNIVKRFYCLNKCTLLLIRILILISLGILFKTNICRTAPVLVHNIVYLQLISMSIRGTINVRNKCILRPQKIHKIHLEPIMYSQLRSVSYTELDFHRMRVCSERTAFYWIRDRNIQCTSAVSIGYIHLLSSVTKTHFSLLISFIQ